MSSANETLLQQISTDLENRLPVAAARCEPTFWGRLFTLQSRWKLAVGHSDLVLTHNDEAVPCDPLNVSLLPGRFWIRLVLKALDGQTILRAFSLKSRNGAGSGSLPMKFTDGLPLPMLPLPRKDSLLPTSFRCCAIWLKAVRTVKSSLRPSSQKRHSLI